MKAILPALALTFAIQAVLAAGIYAPPVLVAAAHQDVGVPASAVGIFTAIAYLAAALGSFMAGPLVARLGPVRASQVCLVVSGFGLAIIASASLPLVVLGAVFLGAAYGPATPASSQLLVALAPNRLRATVLSLKQTGVPAGGVAVGALLPAVSFAFGWKTGVLMLAGSCTLLAVVCEPMRQTLDRPVAPVPSPRGLELWEPLRLVREHARLRELAMVAFLYSGAQLCFATYLVIYLVEVGNLGLVAAGAGMSAFMAGGILGRVVWGTVADRSARGSRVLSALGAASCAMALALIVVIPRAPLGMAIGLCFLCGVSAIAWNGVQLAEVARHAPDGRVAQATALSMMSSYLGVVAAPLLFWLLHMATLSYAAGFALSAAFSLAGAWILRSR